MTLGSLLQLRRTTLDDADILFAWANDPVTRSMSLTSGAITREEHERWLTERLGRADCHMFLARAGTADPAGQVRFERTGDEWRVSVVIAPEARGRGLASGLIESGCRALVDCSGPVRVVADIRPENEASSRAFERAGFRRLGTVGGVDRYGRDVA